MTKIELAIKALEELPPEQREEVAEMVLELTNAVAARRDGSALTDEQWAEVQRRRSRGFRPGDPERINQLLARLK
jgi:hypothetical protein